jgi:2,3-bisphosphoglycerate-independent phosphoglycerate mutase
VDRAKPRRKILLLIVDGLGDLPIDALDGRTPLEAAATPVLDGWVARGRCGLVDPIEPGVTVETHAGTGALMGLSREQCSRLARGPVEAAGAGLELAEGDIALRSNFATLDAVEEGFAIHDRRAGRIDKGMADLAAAVNDLEPEDGVAAFLAPLTRHRGALRLTGPGLSAAITDTDPGAGGRPQRALGSRAVNSGDAAAERTAAALNRYLFRAHEVLRDHPVNRDRVRRGLPPASGLLTRGAGVHQSTDGLVKRMGLSGAVVSGDKSVLGLGNLLGFRPVVDAAFTALLDTDLDAKVVATQAALAENDIVWMHAKGSDIASHDRQPLAKRDYLERLDAAIGPLSDLDLVACVTGDHTTDSNSGAHTSDPVPTLLSAPGGPRDNVTTFGESECLHGGLGRLRAPEFLRVVLAAAGYPSSSGS